MVTTPRHHDERRIHCGMTAPHLRGKRLLDSDSSVVAPRHESPVLTTWSTPTPVPNTSMVHPKLGPQPMPSCCIANYSSHSPGAWPNCLPVRTTNTPPPTVASALPRVIVLAFPKAYATWFLHCRPLDNADVPRTPTPDSRKRRAPSRAFTTWKSMTRTCAPCIALSHPTSFQCTGRPNPDPC